MQSQHGTLVASTVQTITLANAAGDPAMKHVAVINQPGTGAIYFTVASNGATPDVPTVGGADTYCLSAGSPARSVPVGPTNEIQVSLISAGTEAFSVEAE